MVCYVLRLDRGAQIHDGGVTYTYSGKAVIYQSIDELIEKENLDILYPHNLPETLKVRYIINSASEDGAAYTVGFVDGLTAIKISLGEKDTSVLSSETEKFVTSNNVVSYILVNEEMAVSTTVHDGWTYYITTNTLENLKIILENLY